MRDGVGGALCIARGAVWDDHEWVDWVGKEEEGLPALFDVGHSTCCGFGEHA